jgi:hypothetical protein
MKTMSYVLLIIFYCILFSSCQEDDFKSSGIITGYDIRECICCGGFFIDIENETYRFYEVPQNSRLNLDNPSFPIYVKLDWTKDPNACLGDEIIVLRIEQE